MPLDPLLLRSLAQFHSGRPLVVFDTETTGLPQPGLPPPRIWQLAAMKLEKGRADLTHEVLLNVGDVLSADVVRICQVDANISLLHGHEPVLVLAKFARFIEGAVLVGANIVNFDNPIMAEEYRRSGLPIPVQFLDPGWTIDVTLMARALYPSGSRPAPTDPVSGRPSNALINLGRYFGCQFDEAALHGATADVALARQVLDALLNEIKQRQ